VSRERLGEFGDCGDEMTEPVSPELKESPLQRRSELAVKVVLRYLEGVAKVYDCDEQWIMHEIIKRLETKLRD